MVKLINAYCRIDNFMHLWFMVWLDLGVPALVKNQENAKSKTKRIVSL